MKMSDLLKIRYNSVPEFLHIITMNINRNRVSILFHASSIRKLQNINRDILFLSEFTIDTSPTYKTYKKNRLKILCLTESFSFTKYIT